ncbi:MAG TPA: ATP-binding protein [Phnomibacter sp.]|nr:ATP-binding protein [Phnomibacter sp.]
MLQLNIGYHCKCLWICLFGICSGWHAQAQTKYLDSLLQLSKTAPSDSSRLMYLRKYATDLGRYDSAKSMVLLQQGGSEAKAKGLDMLAVDFQLSRSIVLYNRGDYIRSIPNDELTDKMYAQLPESKERTWGLASIQNNLGAAYSLINELELAQQHYLQSVAHFEKLKDSTSLMMVYFNIAFLYIDIQQWQQARNYLTQSLQYVSTKPDYDWYMQSLAREAAVCFRLNKISDGERLLKKADTILPKANLELSKIYYLNASGDYYAATAQWQQALLQHNKAYRLSLVYNDPYYVADEAWEVGRAYVNLKVPDSAEAYLNEALRVARQYNYMPKVKFILKELSAYYGGIGNYKKAWQVSSQLADYTDSLVALQNHNRILLNDARFQTTKKEGRINELESAQLVQQLQIRQKNILNYFLIAAAGTMIIIGALGYRNYRQKQILQQQRINELETEKQLLAAEAVMKGEDRERSRLAKDLHDGLGGMLSGIKHSFQHMKDNLVMTPENQLAFERSMDMLDSSIKELRRVAHNMMPEALVKFGLDTALQDFCAGVNQSGALQLTYESFGLDQAAIDQQTSISIYRIVQELVSNTLKHAAATQAIVQILKTDDGLSITAEDNGKGFDTHLLHSSKGMGWSNIQNRIDYIKGTLNLQSSPGKGTSVLIEIPT